MTAFGSAADRISATVWQPPGSLANEARTEQRERVQQMRRAVAVLATLGVLVAGYAALDAADLTPGLLTTAPAPPPPPTETAGTRTLRPVPQPTLTTSVGMPLPSLAAASSAPDAAGVRSVWRPSWPCPPSTTRRSWCATASRATCCTTGAGPPCASRRPPRRCSPPPPSDRPSPPTRRCAPGSWPGRGPATSCSWRAETPCWLRTGAARRTSPVAPGSVIWPTRWPGASRPRNSRR